MYGNGITTAAHSQIAGAAYNQLAGKAPSPSVIQDATESVRNAIARLDKVLGQLRSAADETFGQLPPTASGITGTNESPATGRAEELRRATSYLHDLVSQVEAEATRFNTL